jgi:hypothetical protein
VNPDVTALARVAPEEPPASTTTRPLGTCLGNLPRYG